uniref:Poly (ADP-ribose) polymerase family, member 12a n=1 Tax=Pygocentrus nattereri TaxID=42514 RepID=A0A3B4EB42_PYGNA
MKTRPGRSWSEQRPLTRREERSGGRKARPSVSFLWSAEEAGGATLVAERFAASTMSDALSASIVRTLCQHGGSLDFKCLSQILSQHFTVADEVLLKVLTDFSKFVVVEGKEKKGDSPLSPDSVVLAKTSLRVCRTLPGQCAYCQDLHLCRYFVCGNCRFGAKCKNAHAVDSSHNSVIRSEEGLQHLEKSELFQLLLQNDPCLLPEVCSHYNKGNGEHGSCKYATSCNNLHLCQHYLQGECKFGADCKRAHSFDANAMRILNGRGLSPENISNFCKIYKNKSLISSYKEKPAVLPDTEKTAAPSTASPAASETLKQPSSRPVSEIDSKEICLFFIRRGCSFKDKCVRIHYHLPYKWQVLDKDGKTWNVLPNGEDIEKAFCNPSNDVSPGPQVVNFITMTCGGASVRRLSTASSVTKPPHFILTTEWIWYWKNDQGVWTEYGQGMDTKHAAPLTSETLENVYHADPHSEIPVSSEKHTYIIYVKDMYQQNVLYKTKREIRRRPRFVSALEVESKLKCETSMSSSVVVPAHWDRGALPEFSYKLVPLSRADAEFVMLEKMFKETMPKHTIISIQRNQNSSLWKVFQWQKEQMKERNAGRDVDERYLFHGTDQSLIQPICEQNFDWRICGVHGTLYGKGSYFARDAKYSDSYAKSKAGPKMMFAALVLVGEFAKGKSSYLRPPQRKDTQSFYDSCVDNEANPAIYVIFEKYQVYPEYIIEYS